MLKQKVLIGAFFLFMWQLVLSPCMGQELVQQPIAPAIPSAFAINDISNVLEEIDKQKDDTLAQKNALKQLAKALSEALTVNRRNTYALKLVTTKIANATACLHTQYESQKASQLGAIIEVMVVDTKKKKMEYELFGQAVSGFTFKLPEDSGCAPP